jgi:hypothetical protein
VSLGRSLVDEVGNQVSCQSVVLSCWEGTPRSE